MGLFSSIVLVVKPAAPRSLDRALSELPGANLALISVPGEYAAHEGGERALFAVLEGRIEELPVEDAGFDCVISNGAIKPSRGSPLGSRSVGLPSKSVQQWRSKSYSLHAAHVRRKRSYFAAQSGAGQRTWPGMWAW